MMEVVEVIIVFAVNNDNCCSSNIMMRVRLTKIKKASQCEKD